MNIYQHAQMAVILLYSVYQHLEWPLKVHMPKRMLDIEFSQSQNFRDAGKISTSALPVCLQSASGVCIPPVFADIPPVRHCITPLTQCCHRVKEMEELTSDGTRVKPWHQQCHEAQRTNQRWNKACCYTSVQVVFPHVAQGNFTSQVLNVSSAVDKNDVFTVGASILFRPLHRHVLQQAA